ncbi:hypothetical protein NQT74_11050 [Alteromonas stellipolaris]|uniref:hypothetical protein n=1 Tax=Alteromonas stellipolaris TaxID=233316 RepID=UPI0021190A8A|nr:hypothetical protein [Alteromonas stellipolaris]MCQ8849119.1 hypothetical protein [Alteromonas stellipolaris]
MKKFIIGLFALVGFSAQAAVINISTDQTSYNVGDTVTANVWIDIVELQGSNLAQPIISGFVMSLMADATSLEYNVGSIMFGDKLGAGALSALFPVLGDTYSIQSAGVPFSTTLFTLQSGLESFDLFSLEFTALSSVSDALFGLTASVTEFGSFVGAPVSTASTAFSVEATSVPAPSTGVLALLACFGMVVSRVKARR